jgi:CRISPR-associated endonuclease Csn1
MSELSGAGGPYVLGIDLGVSSLGWSCVDLHAQSPSAIRDVGVRIFEAGVEGDVEQGKDSSRAAVRREKRQPRRQIERRARRQRKVFRVLQRAGLMPPGPSVEQSQIDAAISALDSALRTRLLPGRDPIAAHVWPYRLRSIALDQPLAPYDLGRAFYHLAQRRGFLSNRKTDKDDEESGKVKSGIADLSRHIAESGKRTLGEYLSTLDPETVRIRQRWTARDMYAHEFEAIWSAQAPHLPQLLTPQLHRRLERAIFKQRPLKSAKGLVGRCELDPQRRRAALALPLAQRHRLLAAVNNLLVFAPDGTKRSLSSDERTKLLNALQCEGDQTFNDIRKLLDLKKSSTRKDKTTGRPVIQPGYSFNLEEGGEKKLPGNRTVSKLLPIFGERWDGMSERQQDEIVQALIEYEHPSALVQRAKVRWSLDDDTAKRFAQVRLEPGYARFSRRALQRLVDRMEEGLPYMTAQKDEYPASLEAKPAMDRLPPVLDAIKDMRNPAVCRALTELRKVVNAIVRKHGKPAAIRLEMARDLRQPRKQREQTWKRNRDREDERKIAASKIKAARLVVGEPKRDAIERWLLADECNWMCPYTGKIITPELLLGPHPQFDVEHIVPFSVSLDNTFINKTLCDTHFNRHRKVNRLPTQCFDPVGQEWHEVLLRVRRFHSNAAAVKLERFAWTSVPDEFTNRHLQDTRYTSRLAGEYLGLLYGGSCDEEGTRRVQVSAGGVTAFLRDEWGMNGILNDGGIKTRDDHRHHAVDAITIALTSPATVKMLSDAAEGAAQVGRKRFAQVAEPWVGFLDHVRESIERIVVSHRTNRRVNGPLHEETNYSKPKSVTVKGKPATVHHVRKPLASMSLNEVNDIVDNRIRELVKAQLNGGDPRKVFADGSKLPSLPTHHGQAIPIRKARIRKTVATLTVGDPRSPRYVAPGSNHHMAIVAVLDDHGREMKWEGHLVSRFDAMQRLRRDEPVVQKDWGPKRKIKFTLCPNDIITAIVDKRPISMLVTGVSDGEITCRRIDDARPVTVVRKLPLAEKKDWLFRPSASTLFGWSAQKVTVSPIGEVLPAND